MYSEKESGLLTIAPRPLILNSFSITFGPSYFYNFLRSLGTATGGEGIYASLPSSILEVL